MLGLIGNARDGIVGTARLVPGLRRPGSETATTYDDVVSPRAHAPSKTLLTKPPSMAMLREHRDEILEIATRRGVSNIRVFGSVARGDAGSASDVDLLVDFDTSHVGSTSSPSVGSWKSYSATELTLERKSMPSSATRSRPKWSRCDRP